ncbi:MAG TPA: DUF692 family protein [Ornithinibacter sp.]|nr:DUF692 family protein [Ornithinibacter sp.]
MNNTGPRLGLAYSKQTPLLIEEHPDLVDYVEIPYELLRFSPGVAEVCASKPVVLHCASLSVAGSVQPPPGVLDDVVDWLDRTQSPWLGEHLSFITAHRDERDLTDAYAPGEPWNIGYTVSPQLTEQSLQRVIDAVGEIQAMLPVPLILENPPIYFTMPGSTMSQLEFIDELCRRCDVGLLLDLAHFYITARTLGREPLRDLEAFPLARVIEVHVSGVDEQQGGYWDNHAARAPQAELDLLARVVEQARVQAVTLEYNWSSSFARDALLGEVERVRSVVHCPATTTAHPA